MQKFPFQAGQANRGDLSIEANLNGAPNSNAVLAPVLSELVLMEPVLANVVSGIPVSGRAPIAGSNASCCTGPITSVLHARILLITRVLGSRPRGKLRNRCKSFPINSPLGTPFPPQLRQSATLRRTLLAAAPSTLLSRTTAFTELPDTSRFCGTFIDSQIETRKSGITLAPFRPLASDRRRRRATG